MNVIVPTNGVVGGLVPTSMAEAMKLAEMMASAKLVPPGLQKSPADCLMVIQQAIRWQMDPFAVAQECSVIQGKLMHSGKLVAAVVNARGNLTQRLSFDYHGAGPERTITVTGLLQGEATPRVVEVVLKNAQTNNRVWQTQPDQQLAYHGTRVWARRHTPELMLGVYSPEEFDEEQKSAKRPAPPAANVMLPLHDASTGEIIENQSGTPGANPDPKPAPPPFEQSRSGLNEMAEEVPADLTEAAMKYDEELAAAAETGDMKALESAWKLIPRNVQPTLKSALDRRHKPRCKEMAEAARALL